MNLGSIQMARFLIHCLLLLFSFPTFAQEQFNQPIPLNETTAVQQYVTSESGNPPSQPGSLPTVGGDTQAAGAAPISPVLASPTPAQAPQVAVPTAVVAPTTVAPNAPLASTVIPSPSAAVAAAAVAATASLPTPALPASGYTLYPNAPNGTPVPVQPPPTDLPPPVLPTVQTILPTPYLLPAAQTTTNAVSISGENIPANSAAQATGQPTTPDFLVERPPVQEFVGGLNQNAFVACEKAVTQLCTRAPDIAQFQVCLNQFRAQPGCKQFSTFASLSGFAPGSFVDLMQHYKEARLTLLHLSRGGVNYAGDYYAVGADGNFVNLTSGPEAQAIDITKNVAYPALVERFSNVQLWSLVDQLPRASVPANGRGLSLVFRFLMLNGCISCERVGYAYVAYDFSELGALQNMRLLTLETLGTERG